MPDDVPDLSPGSKVGELSHAAQAAVQISSMRREAADRRGLESLRVAEEQVAQLERVRSDWERMRQATEAAMQLANDTRFEVNHAVRVSAFSRQQSDGAVLEYGDALQAPSGAVSPQELRRLEREVQLTARRAEADAHLAARAERACSKANVRYDVVAHEQVLFEQEHGIETGHSKTLHDAAARPEAAAARQFLDPTDAARWQGVAEAERQAATGEFAAGAPQFGVDDDLTTPVPEDDVATERGRVHVGRGTDELANADAATAAAGAARVAFTARPGSTSEAATAAPRSPFVTPERGRTR